MKVDFTKRLRNVSGNTAEAFNQILNQIASMQDDIEANNREISENLYGPKFEVYEGELDAGPKTKAYNGEVV